MKKLFLMLFVTLIVTLSVKAETGKPIVETILLNTEIKKIGNMVLFIDNYQIDSTCSEVLKQGGCNIYSMNKQKAKGFIVKKYIPDDILLITYEMYKKYGNDKNKMPIYDAVFTKCIFGKNYLSRIDYSDVKKIVIDGKNEEIKYVTINIPLEKHTNIFTWLLILITIIYGYIVGVSYYKECDEMNTVLLLIVIIGILEFFSLVASRNGPELGFFIFNIILFIIGAGLLGGFGYTYGKIRFIISTIVSFIFLVTCWFIYLYRFNDTLIPKILTLVFVTSTILSHLYYGWNDINNPWIPKIKEKILKMNFKKIRI